MDDCVWGGIVKFWKKNNLNEIIITQGKEYIIGLILGFFTAVIWIIYLGVFAISTEVNGLIISIATLAGILIGITTIFTFYSPSTKEKRILNEARRKLILSTVFYIIGIIALGIAIFSINLALASGILNEVTLKQINNTYFLALFGIDLTQSLTFIVLFIILSIAFGILWVSAFNFTNGIKEALPILMKPTQEDNQLKKEKMKKTR